MVISLCLAPFIFWVLCIYFSFFNIVMTWGKILKTYMCLERKGTAWVLGKNHFLLRYFSGPQFSNPHLYATYKFIVFSQSMSLQSFINSDFSQYKTYTQMLPKGILVLICAAENCLQFKYIPANAPQWIAIKKWISG